MACYRPIVAFQPLSGGSVVFVEGRDMRQVLLPCSRCVGCRLEYARQWAVRCMHEKQMHDENCYVTLTYDDVHLPFRSSLCYRDFQLFMKRVRASNARVRFFVAGEYGDKDWRPHFHALLFGLDFPDRYYWSTNANGDKLYRSATLERLWPLGFSTVGGVSFQSAAYVARYVMKKVTGDAADKHYERVDPDTGEVYSLVPEFVHMSLKPGIGASWIRRFGADVYPKGKVVVNGVEAVPPRYYDKVFAAADPGRWEDLQHRRLLDARARADDNTPERLAVKEVVARARVSRLKRSI